MVAPSSLARFNSRRSVSGSELGSLLLRANRPKLRRIVLSQPCGFAIRFRHDSLPCVEPRFGDDGPLPFEFGCVVLKSDPHLAPSFTLAPAPTRPAVQRRARFAFPFDSGPAASRNRTASRS